MYKVPDQKDEAICWSVLKLYSFSWLAQDGDFGFEKISHIIVFLGSILI